MKKQWIVALSLGMGAFVSLVWLTRRGSPAGHDSGQVLRGDFRPTRLSMEGPSVSVTLEESTDGWALTSPVRAKADQVKVARLIERLTALKSMTIAAPDRSQPGPYGLDGAAIAVHSTWSSTRGTSIEHVHLIGAAVPGGTYVAVDSDQRVYLGPEGLRADFSAPYAELRDRRVLSFAPAAVQRLSVQMGGRRWSVERTSDGWRRAKPSASIEDNARIESILTMLAESQALDYVDDLRPSDAAALNSLGFAHPAAAVTLVLATNSHTLLVSESDVHGGHRVYVREAAGGPVMVVDGNVLELLRTIMAALSDSAEAASQPSTSR